LTIAFLPPDTTSASKFEDPSVVTCAETIPVVAASSPVRAVETFIAIGTEGARGKIPKECR
jgi:hypothetical protein